MGQVTTVVHAINASLLGRATSEIRIPHVGIPRRLSHRAISLRRRGGSGSLCGRKTVHRPSALFSRVATSSDEGGVDRVYKCGTPGGASRHGGDAILRHSAQGEESTVVSTENAERSSVRASLGYQEGDITPLRCVRVTDARYAVGQIIYKVAVLGYGNLSAQRCTWAGPLQPPERARPAEVANADSPGASRTPHGTTGSYHGHSLIRRGCWLGWYAKLARLTSRCIRTMAGPGNLDFARPSGEHQLQGAKGDMPPVDRKFRKASSPRRTQEHPYACGQPSCGSYQERLCLGQSPHDARATPTKGRVGAARRPDQIGMDSISGQLVRRRIIATLPTRQLADPTAAAAFRSGWNGGPNR